MQAEWLGFVLRRLLESGGAALAAWMVARGYGDDALWRGVLEALIPGAVSALTWAWSWHATKRQMAMGAGR